MLDIKLTNKLDYIRAGDVSRENQIKYIMIDMKLTNKLNYNKLDYTHLK